MIRQFGPAGRKGPVWLAGTGINSSSTARLSKSWPVTPACLWRERKIGVSRVSATVPNDIHVALQGVRHIVVIDTEFAYLPCCHQYWSLDARTFSCRNFAFDEFYN